MTNKHYGRELILDLHDCNPATFNRYSIEQYFVELCIKIDMKRCDLHFWDDLDTPEEEKQTSPHTKGTSAVQFILTSNITIHTLDDLRKVFINIFSCKDFLGTIASEFSVKWFQGRIVQTTFIKRL